MAARTEQHETPAPAPAFDVNALAAAIAAGVSGLAPKPELKEGDPEYRARQMKEGWFDAFDGGVTVLQNAYEANPRGETAQVRYRAAHLKPGKYLKGRVGVSIESNGSIVRLSYPIKGDENQKNMAYFSSFGDLINKIWDEQGGGPEPAYPPPAA